MERARRIADVLRRELAPLIQEELRDPRIGFVTLTEVRLSPDLRHARVYVTVLADDEEPTLDALNHAVPFLRRALSKRSGLRFTPQLRFMVDDVEAKSARLDDILDGIRADRPDEDTEDASEQQPDVE